MCPYHGWQYGGDGVCTHIPQLEDPTKVPGKARVDAFTALERYGNVWIVLDEPRYELPDIPEFDDPDWIVVKAGPYAWNSDASRQPRRLEFHKGGQAMNLAFLRGQCGKDPAQPERLVTQGGPHPFTPGSG